MIDEKHMNKKTKIKYNKGRQKQHTYTWHLRRANSTYRSSPVFPTAKEEAIGFADSLVPRRMILESFHILSFLNLGFYSIFKEASFIQFDIFFFNFFFLFDLIEFCLDSHV